MGRPRKAHKVKLIAGLLSNDADRMNRAEAILTKMFGEIDFASPVMDFSYSTYYDKEMGSGLKRRILSFKKLVSAKNIYSVKLKTNSLERRLMKDSRRTVNIDPGYIDLAKLVLFSTKDYTHRIYLDKGIFAEVTLFYKEGRFNTWGWTYPDYKSDAYINVFNSIRELYLKGRAEWS